MATYTLTATGTSANLAFTISSTKIKVQSNGAACFYNINANCFALSGGNKGIIPANGVPVYINMGGINQVLAVNTGSSTATLTITECGTVFQSALNQNSTTFKNT